MNEPKVKIVIVNWNKKQCVSNLLNSLEKINYENFSVLVVDNASSDGSVEHIKKNFPRAGVIVNSVNLGGTGGFNAGMAAALNDKDADFIWLLDNDVVITQDSLAKLVYACRTDEKIAAAGSCVFYLDYPEYIFEAGGHLDWGRGIFLPYMHNKKADEAKTKENADVDYCSACSVLVRKDALREAGLMDENFFWGGDDLEWTNRFKKLGFRVVAAPASKVYHQYKTVIAPWSVYYNCRNSFYLYSKFSPYKRNYGAIARLILTYSCLLAEAEFFNFNTILNLYSKAINDCFAGKMGKAKLTMPEDFLSEDYDLEHLENIENKKILINSVDKSDDLVINALKRLEKKNAVKILVRDDKIRLKGFEKYFHCFSYKDLASVFSLFKNKYDLAVCFSEQRGSMLAYLLSGKTLVFEKNGKFAKYRNNKAVIFFAFAFKALGYWVKYFSKYMFKK